MEADDRAEKLEEANRFLEEEIAQGEAAVAALQEATVEQFATLQADREQLLQRNIALQKHMQEVRHYISRRSFPSSHHVVMHVLTQEARVYIMR